MIFYIIDYIYEIISDIKKSHRKNPKKLRIFFTWLTLVILVTLIFYLFGAFSNSETLPLKLNSEFSESNLNPVKPKFLKKIPIQHTKNVRLNNVSSPFSLSEGKEVKPWLG